MAKVEIVAGASYDVASSQELRDLGAGIDRKFDALIRQYERGIKLIKISSHVVDNVAGVVTGEIAGPAAGYAWSVRRLSVKSDAAGGALTFDFYRATDTGVKPSQWVANLANLPGVLLFSKAQFTLNPDDNIIASFTGTNTGNVYYVNGEVVEVPAEMLGKIVG